MIVKVKDQIFDAEQVPILVVLSDQDLENIGNMPDGHRRYAAYPEGTPYDKISAWMDDLPLEVIGKYDLMVGSDAG